MSDSNPTDPSPRGATLRELARECDGATVVGAGEARVRDVQHDSRSVRPGDLFVARKGFRDDGARYVRDALARGAAAIAASSGAGIPDGTDWIEVPDVELALARFSAAVWAHPTWTLDVIGITGTNGKTTTAWLVEHALTRLGERPGLLGTVEHRFGTLHWPALHTTPEADDLARRFGAMQAAGANFAVMEVSSHAIALKRVAAVRFRVAALTNVTQDHLDLHGTFERYALTKRALFEQYGPGVSVLNLDDAVGRASAEKVSAPITYSASGREAVVRRVAGGAHATGIDATVQTPDGEVPLVSPLVGAHNVENLLAALSILGGLEIPWRRAAEALEDARGAPGRLERVTLDARTQDFEVLVDYAHTPDALERVIATLRTTTKGRILCVFGCGGDRDPTKRPRMGEAVARGADVAIVTTDNPRSEDPEAILAHVLEGMRAMDRAALHVEVDRRRAIAWAVSAARAGDVVLIAGKGHETYQEVRGVRHAFDDREEALAALRAR